ncbi:hypothetical protein AB1Y20_016049 [Prymnesium parvum]|uniref:Cobalamin biosynthesis protein CbiX n=1 Tax=Prymnesium parvum TaxID=97485 RepID=A0AB34K2S9_PRYPA
MLSAGLLPVLLLDNGSFRPTSVLALRKTADALGDALGGRTVLPVSLQFSNSIAAAALGGRPAHTLREGLRSLTEQGERRVIVAPLFLGPSDSYSRGLSQCVAEFEAEGVSLAIHVGACLVDLAQPHDDRVARALAALVREVGEEKQLEQPLKVVVVDHGTPSPQVNAVRERLTNDIRTLLGERASVVAAASMERRDGAEYDFNEPLLENLLQTPPFQEGDVVLAMAFLQPGKHAGEGGDIAQIVERACHQSPGLRVHSTPLLASQSLVLEVLRDRVLAAEATNPAWQVH